MAEYRRFVAYVYEYPDGKKGNGKGFIKVEVRDGLCRMNYRISGMYGKDSVPCRIYGFVRHEQECEAIFLGNCNLAGDKIQFEMEMPEQNLGGSSYGINDLSGLIMLTLDGSMYGTGWDDKPVRLDEMRLPDIMAEKLENEHEDPIGADAKFRPETPESIPHTPIQDVRRAKREEKEAEEVIEAIEMQQPEDEEKDTSAQQEDRNTKDFRFDEQEEEFPEMPERAELNMPGRNERNERDEREIPQSTIMPERTERNMPGRNERNERETPQSTLMPERTEPEMPGSNERYERNIRDDRYERNARENPENSVMPVRTERENPDLSEIPEILERSPFVIPEENAGITVPVEQDRETPPMQNTRRRQHYMEFPEENPDEKYNFGQEQSTWNRESGADGMDLLEELDQDEDAIRHMRQVQTEENRKRQAEEIQINGQSARAAKKQETFCPFPDGEITECRQVSPSDFRILSHRDRGLMNNNFLRHGFRRYHHVLIGKNVESGRYILGVPGVYDRQECLMAGMFGFPNFKPAKTLSKNTSPRFGYWYRSIDSPNMD